MGQNLDGRPPEPLASAGEPSAGMTAKQQYVPDDALLGSGLPERPWLGCGDDSERIPNGISESLPKPAQVANEQFLKSMIPHHPRAMSELCPTEACLSLGTGENSGGIKRRGFAGESLGTAAAGPGHLVTGITARV